MASLGRAGVASNSAAKPPDQQLASVFGAGWGQLAIPASPGSPKLLTSGNFLVVDLLTLESPTVRRLSHNFRGGGGNNSCDLGTAE